MKPPKKLVELNKTICLNKAQGPRGPPKMIYLTKSAEELDKIPAARPSNARPATPATPTRKRILSDPSNEEDQADAKRTSAIHVIVHHKPEKTTILEEVKVNQEK